VTTTDGGDVSPTIYRAATEGEGQVQIDSCKETGAKILVVDDEPLIVDVLRRVLSKAGHTVVAAATGKEALKKALETRPDLVIMDIVMPEGDGYQAAVNIKRHPLLHDIPVIFLTGRATEEDGGRSLATGGAVYLHKPFIDSQIRDVVSLVLRSVSRTAANPSLISPQ
jgi:CheY-like chemotaxis protein